jgi:inner membrane protein
MSTFSLKSSVVTRMIIVGFLTMLLLVPATMIEQLIVERSARREEAVAEISAKWAGPQTVIGPVLTIPVKGIGRDSEGKHLETADRVNILPDSLDIDGALSTEARYRGIFHVVLYNGKLTARGTFNPAAVFADPAIVPQWDKAFVTIGVSDLRGIKENVVLRWNATALNAEAGVRTKDIAESGITFAPTIADTSATQSFSFALDLNGSSSLSVAPLGRRTSVRLSSPWSSPSFDGAFLPERRTVTSEGFTAEWRVLELNRNYPQTTFGAMSKPEGSTFGVSLLQPVDEYQQTLRTTKYAILIVALTFIALFLSEVLAKQTLHPVHYSLVGFALLLFYLLVLALSEHFGFDAAYAASSATALALVTLYTLAIVSKKRIAAIIALMLVILYACLYALLQLEDYALLIGSLALVVVLGATMYLTRRGTWYVSDQCATMIGVHGASSRCNMYVPDDSAEMSSAILPAPTSMMRDKTTLPRTSTRRMRRSPGSGLN